MYEGGVVVAKGRWFYDGTVACSVLVQRLPIFYGSGDPEDPPEFREDRDEETYYSWYESPAHQGTYPAGGGCASSLEKAKEMVADNLRQQVKWDRV